MLPQVEGYIRLNGPDPVTCFTRKRLNRRYQHPIGQAPPRDTGRGNTNHDAAPPIAGQQKGNTLVRFQVQVHSLLSETLGTRHVSEIFGFRNGSQRE
jgi:hypothetical protein